MAIPRAADFEYRSILNDGLFAKEGANAELAQFFIDVAAMMSHPLPVPLEAQDEVLDRQFGIAGATGVWSQGLGGGLLRRGD